jgi:predicted phosphoadenosine phosphosulfate sulfurtransferase
MTKQPSGLKRYIDQNVYDAAVERLNRVFDEFEHVQVSFSGGKDSSVLLSLTLEVAERRGRLPVRALFIDLEGQYRATIEHVEQMFNDPRVLGTWICLPLNLRNAVSQHQPHWSCWDPGARDLWVRDLPQHPTVLSDPGALPFFRYRMEFEEFVPKFEEWQAEQLGGKLAVLVGIRSDESLNRFRTIRRHDIEAGKGGIKRHCGWSWSTAWSESCVNLYPIYDWHVDDVWTYIGRNHLPYNRLYDWMWLHGTTLHDMRICQPYGDDQRVGLDQFHAIEPDTWARILRRVEGVNFGARYANQRLLGYRHGLGLPPEMATRRRPWKAYTKLLLASLPPDIAAHYREKFRTFMLWWRHFRRKRGYPGMFDAGIKHPQTGRNIPSWERMALCILKNDYWCHSLKFGQTTKMYERQQELKAKYREL